MEKNIEIEKKYLVSNNVSKEYAIKSLLHILGLNHNPQKVLINQDTYYDYDNILKGQGINARQRKVRDKVEYTLKIKVASKMDEREELNFVSLEEMLDYINNNLHLPLQNLYPTLKLLTRRNVYYYHLSDSIIEICFDEVRVYFENKSFSQYFMIECELKRGNAKDLAILNDTIRKKDFFKPCNLSKKDLALSKIDSRQKLIRQRTKY